MPSADCATVLCAVRVETVSKYLPCGSVGDAFSFYFRPKLLSNSDSFVVLPTVQSSWLELLQNNCFQAYMEIPNNSEKNILV